MTIKQVSGMLDLVYDWMNVCPELFNEDTDNYHKLYTFLTVVCEMDSFEASMLLREKGWA